MGPDDITTTWLSEILGGAVDSMSSERIGDGLVGMNLRVRLAGAEPGLPESVVIKMPSLDPVSRATGSSLRNYEREVRFYLDIAPTVEISVPKCFFGEWNPDDDDFVLVLQDMHPAVQGDQIAACGIDDAHASIDELARLHGPRWDDQSLFEIDWLTRRSSVEDAEQLQMIWSMMLPGFLSTYATYLDSEGVDLIERFSGALLDWVNGREGPMAVTHGDYRLDNLLFDRTSGAVRVTAVDWQTPGHGVATADLAYFCGAGLSVEDRRRHERALVERYAAGLDAYGIRVDDTWLWQSYARDAFAGVIMAVVASQIVGGSDRSEAMFAAMATRHTQHALDLEAISLI